MKFEVASHVTDACLPGVSVIAMSRAGRFFGKNQLKQSYVEATPSYSFTPQVGLVTNRFSSATFFKTNSHQSPFQPATPTQQETLMGGEMNKALSTSERSSESLPTPHERHPEQSEGS